MGQLTRITAAKVKGRLRLTFLQGRSRFTERKSILFPTQEDFDMQSPIVKRSIVVGGHKTSVSLEEAFWNGVKEISGARGKTLSELVSEIDGSRQQGNLSSAIRLFVLDYFKAGAPSAIWP
jgi:predicted DNA-binding ribbon-helix-helix protein